MTDQRKPRGLAAASEETKRRVSQKGGKCSSSRGFRDTPGLASAAGRKSVEGMTPQQLSDRAKKASLAAAEARRKKALDGRI